MRHLPFAITAAALAGAGIAGSSAAQAQSAPPAAIRFAPGTTGASVKGVIRGYGDATYTLGVRKGQMAMITLTASDPSLYFNLVTPSGISMAADETTFRDPLPEGGTYRIIVYLHRNAARRGVSVPYTLSVSVK